MNSDEDWKSWIFYYLTQKTQEPVKVLKMEGTEQGIRYIRRLMQDYRYDNEPVGTPAIRYRPADEGE